MGGSSSSAPLVSSGNSSLDTLNQRGNTRQSASMQDLLAKVGSGQISIKDALSGSQRSSLDTNSASSPLGMLSQMSSTGDTTKNSYDPDFQNQFRDALATDPTMGSEVAKYYTANDPTLAGLFGEGGLQGQAENQYGVASNDMNTDRQALMGRDSSYGLNNQDLAAYGQAAGNITRMSGNQEQGLSEALASRGIGAGSSGSANQAFSNNYGNKFEQLAGLQTQIAQNRVNTAAGLAQSRMNADMARQANSGNLATNLGSLGQNAISNQFNRQLAGSQNNYGQLLNTSNANSHNQELQQDVNNEKFAQEQATKTPSLGEAITNGFVSGAGYSSGQIASSPGQTSKGFSQSFGQGLGKLSSMGMGGGG